MFQQPVLALDDAKRVAAAARAQAQSSGWAVVIAIVDDGGHLMYLERMDGCQKASSRIAEQKGRTAILFKRPTKAIEDVVLEGRTVMMGLPGAVPLAGRLPALPLAAAGFSPPLRGVSRFDMRATISSTVTTLFLSASADAAGPRKSRSSSPSSIMLPFLSRSRTRLRA
jgi:hypothetical protein